MASRYAVLRRWDSEGDKVLPIRENAGGVRTRGEEIFDSSSKSGGYDESSSDPDVTETDKEETSVSQDFAGVSGSYCFDTELLCSLRNSDKTWCRYRSLSRK